MKRRRYHPRVLAEIVKRQDGNCACCGEPLGTVPRLIEYDHEVALADGGEDHPDNLQALTKACHRAKTNRENSERAKVSRLAKGPRMNRQDRMLARYLEEHAESS